MDVRSSTAHALSALLGSVEDELHIHIIQKTSSRTTEVQLPRLKLDFHFTEGSDQIWSRQYRGMILDDDQRVSTLVGLTSKLVLRNAVSTKDRLVLIPEGVIRFSKSRDHHVSVTVGRQDNTKVHAYPIDTTLGRVLDSGALQSKLLLCYLHALTSHCLHDPLTGHTGTEAALAILRSSAVRSFDIITLENIKLLNKIAVLSPSRSFYPVNEQVMQQIDWITDLSPLSQHCDFHYLVKDILEHERRMALFRSSALLTELGREELTWMSSVDPHLHQRASIRNSVFLISGYGAEKFTTNPDSIYQARDLPLESNKGQRAFAAARMTIRDPAAPDVPVFDLSGVRQHFNRSKVHGANDVDIPPALCYDSKWLGQPTILMEELWCTLHHCLTSASARYNRFDIMIWLSTMAYGSAADMSIIRTLLGFYRMQELADITVPRTICFDLVQGTAFQVNEIRTAMQMAVRPYEDSEEAKLPKQGFETEIQHLRRIEELFRTRKEAAIKHFVEELRQQWPCEQPSTPCSGGKFIDCGAAMESVSRKFMSWYNNRNFQKYMDNTASMIQRFRAAHVVIPRFVTMPTLLKPTTQDEDRHCDSIAIFGRSPLAISRDLTSVGTDSLIAPNHLNLPLAQPSEVSAVCEARTRLDDFCETLDTCARSSCEQKYVENLRASCESFYDQERDSRVDDRLVNEHAQDLLRGYLTACEHHVQNFDSKLAEILKVGTSQSTAIASQIDMSPRITPMLWLGQLNRDRYDLLTKEWQGVVIDYGLAITNLHRAQRLVALCDRPVELNEELRHSGHINWSPAEYPETLLLEAESGIIVREVQAQIAEHMMHPEGNHNMVMQLNMGEGKSSTIVPIVAASLADKKK